MNYRLLTLMSILMLFAGLLGASECDKLFARVMGIYRGEYIEKPKLVVSTFEEFASDKGWYSGKADDYSTEQKEKLMAIYGISIIVDISDNKIILTKVDSKTNNLKQKLLKEMEKGSFDMSTALNFVLESDTKTTKAALKNIKKLRKKIRMKENRDLKRSFDKFSEIKGIKQYDSRLWELISLDLTDPVGMVVKLLLDEAMNSKYIGESLKYNILALEEVFTKKLDGVIDRLPWLTEGQKKNWKKYLNAAMIINMVCEGGNYLDIMTKAAKDVDTFVKANMEKDDILTAAKKLSQTTVEDVRGHIKYIEDNYEQAFANVIENTFSRIEKLGDSGVVGACSSIAVANDEVGKLMTEADKYRAEISASMHLIGGKYIVDTVKASNFNMTKDDCNEYVKNQAKKVLEKAAKLVYADMLLSSK